MADDLHPFGVTASDPFDFADENYALVSLDRGTSSSVDAADNGEGEYHPQSQISFGKKQNLSATYKAQVSGAISARELLAGTPTPVALETIEISTAKGARTTVTANGHKHIGGTNTNHNNLLRTLAIPQHRGFGASSFGLEIGVPAASLQSGTYTITIGHTDDDDADGNFLCGSSHGEVHRARFEAIDETSWTIPTGWIEEAGNENGESNQANNAHGKRSLSIVKYVGRTTPQPLPPSGGDD